MSSSIRIFTFALVLWCGLQAQAADLSKIYVDKTKKVHVVLPSGQDKRLTKSGKALQASIAPNGDVAAWLVENNWAPPGQTAPGSSALNIYRKGTLHTIKCEPFIRDYWFFEDGNKVVIDCGGLHFAGSEVLYDTSTLKEIDRYEPDRLAVKNRPPWGSDKYNPGSD